MSLPELASWLGTRIEVITALERGDVRNLPAWPETVRVVTAFTGLAKIDPRPVLFIMRGQLESVAAPAAAPVLRRARFRPAALSPIAHRTARAFRAAIAARGRRVSDARAAFRNVAFGLHDYAKALRRISIATLALAAISTAAYAAYYVRTGGLQASVASLPPPLSGLARRAQDYILWYAAPTHDGLKWIDVEDPRSRRGDRLDTRSRR